MRFEKAQDPANTVRGLARAVELLRGTLARASAWWAAWPTAEKEIAPPRADRSAARLAGAQAGPRHRRRRSARHSGAPGIRRERAGAAAVFASPCLRGAPPRIFPSRTTWWKKSAAWWATIPSRRRRRWCPRACRPRNPDAPVPARGARHLRRPGLHRGLQLFVPERGSRARRSGWTRGARARGQSHCVRPGVDAHFAAARNLAQRARKRQAPRERSGCSKSGWRFTRQARRAARRDSAPGGGDLRALRRRPRRHFSKSSARPSA